MTPVAGGNADARSRPVELTRRGRDAIDLSVAAQSRIEAGWAALVGDASMAQARAVARTSPYPLAASRLRYDQPGERPLSGYDAGLAVFAADDAFVVDVSKLHHHLAAWPRPAERSRGSPSERYARD